MLNFFFVGAAWATSVAPLQVSVEQVPEPARWMYNAKATPKGGVLVQAMVEAKKAQLAKDKGKCLKQLDKALKLGASLGPWITLNRLQCAMLKDSKGKVLVADLQKAIDAVESEPKWMALGPAASSLRTAYIQALLAVADVQSKSDRTRTWRTLDKLSQVRSWLSSDERASIYRWAGEVSFVDQNLSAAQFFLLRSLNEKDSTEIRNKVQAIRTQLLGKKKDSGKETSAETGPPEDLGVSDEEKEIAARMNRAMDSQDYLSAIEDGVQLIQKFPGSKRAQEASDRVLDVYLSISNRTEDKFRNVREAAVKVMAKVDSARMSRWAQNAYARSQYADALLLAESAVTKYDGHPDTTKILLLAAKSALASGGYDEARTLFERVVREHSGTPEAAEAYFRLGLLEFRQKRFTQASAYFERVLALPQGKDFEYRALYWQWRTQQRVDFSKTAISVHTLAAKYPLTYYGLRARAELNNNVLQLPNQKQAIKMDLPYFEHERLAWERLNLLLKSGWLKEAEKELDALPDPQVPEEKMLHSRLWAGALRYDEAISLYNKATEENPELLQTNTLRWAFPLEFETQIVKEAKSSGVSEAWIWALMRQESSFRPDVKSPAGALGLMQLLFPTAQEIARDYKMKDLTNDAMLTPDVNIKLGSVYLGRLIKAFNGHIPLALAAYNAGPTRLRRWLSARKDLSPLEGQATSNPEVEVWIDELPWEETSGYVKSILRNWLIYRGLENAKVELGDPIWVDVKPSSR